MAAYSDHELLTRSGPGTPLGNFMREYWVPAALSSELKADGAPMRLMLLGEKLVAFRDTKGRVGIMDHRCPHRCASLFFGRNEKGGLRCAYHGWKFDVEGNCLDMPNVPKHQAFAEKVKARAYPAVERYGLIWTYMGARKEPPPMPCFESVMIADEAERTIFAVQRECNYLQALEGDIDTSHLGFLHLGNTEAEDADPTSIGRHALENRAPEYHVADTDWGTMYAAYRPGGPNEIYWRFAHFMFPFWTIPPDGNFRDHVFARAWVPMDDEHMMFIHCMWNRSSSGLRTRKDATPIPGMTRLGPEDYLPPGTGWLDRWKLKANSSNDYMMDREAQRTNTLYAGIDGIHLQDQAITESMGGIVDHAMENLAISDLMISRTRRRIVRAVRAHMEGIVPPGVDNPELYQGARGGDFVGPSSIGWLQAYSDEMRASQNPTGKLRMAAE